MINSNSDDCHFEAELRVIEDLGKKLEKGSLGLNGGFKLFGDNLTEAYLNLSRTRVRRIERRIVDWNGNHDQKLSKTGVLAYLNRVSDILYLMSINKKGSPKHRAR